jgi:hypothetical protein
MVLECVQRHVQEYLWDGYPIKIVYGIPDSPRLFAAKLLHHKTYNFTFLQNLQEVHNARVQCASGSVKLCTVIKSVHSSCIFQMKSLN